MSSESLSRPAPSPSADSPNVQLTEYRGADRSRSIWQLVSTLAGFISLWWLSWLSLERSYLLTLLLAVPTAGFLVRLFILCTTAGTDRSSSQGGQTTCVVACWV